MSEKIQGLNHIPIPYLYEKQNGFLCIHGNKNIKWHMV